MRALLDKRARQEEGGAVQRGKLVGFVDIGGGLKAFTAKQSLTGKGFFQV